MRILFVNDGVGDAGGVQNYLVTVADALRQRGHDLALLHLDEVRDPAASPMPGAPHFCLARDAAAALAAAARWTPTVVFSHNMRDLDAEESVFALAPVVKMMHGYFGTCVSGHKMHRAPRAAPCGRKFGAPCLALYVPRRCGALSVGALLGGYAHARRQREFFERYHALVVASAHMRDEYVRNGAPAHSVASNPLFAPVAGTRERRRETATAGLTVLFLGRMTHLKGGDYLIRAIARAGGASGPTLRLVMAGDGPQRQEWEALASRLNVRATFTGWVESAGRDELFRAASVLAIPSVWPEPFGLCGLEAGAAGVPSIAFDVGGIHEWLRDGENGRLIPFDGQAVDRLAQALVELRADPERLTQLGSRALAVAREMSVDAHVSRLEDVLRAAAQRTVARA